MSLNDKMIIEQDMSNPFIKIQKSLSIITELKYSLSLGVRLIIKWGQTLFNEQTNSQTNILLNRVFPHLIILGHK